MNPIKKAVEEQDKELMSKFPRAHQMSTLYMKEVQSYLHARDRAIIEAVVEMVEMYKFDLTTVEETVAAGMSQVEAQTIYAYGNGYLTALTDLITRLKSNLE